MHYLPTLVLSSELACLICKSHMLLKVRILEMIRYDICSEFLPKLFGQFFASDPPQ